MSHLPEEIARADSLPAQVSTGQRREGLLKLPAVGEGSKGGLVLPWEKSRSAGEWRLA